MDLPHRGDLGPNLPDRLRSLYEAEFPRFSADEMKRRRKALADALAEAGAAHALLSGGDRKGSAIQWLTGWPPGGGHFVAFTPGEGDTLFVKNPNNAALARIMAPEAAVGWGPEGSLVLIIDELLKRGAKGKTVGVIGSYGHSLHERLAAAGIKPIDINRVYTRLRLVKSAEELDWLRIGCALTDLGVEALERNAAPGLTEHQLGDIIERAYVPFGGMTQIHYTGVTSMKEPDCCVPSQLPRNRVVHAGDVVFTEISASFWSYPGQVQRTIAVAQEPTPLYRDLHAAAEEAFDAVVKVLRPGAKPNDVLDAASCIARSGFTICDDLLHGYGGGGYLPPVLGTRERPSGPVPDLAFQENMTVVVQPSVMTKDGKAGVQTGELVLITANGIERMHRAPWGFRRAG
jgi:Xaa-Pro aminopeptidase